MSNLPRAERVGSTVHSLADEQPPFVLFRQQRQRYLKQSILMKHIRLRDQRLPREQRVHIRATVSGIPVEQEGFTGMLVDL